jgi:magnesium chelatase family protein
MLATVFSRASFGMQAPPVTIDVHVTSGLPTLTVVGLPEAAVKESKDRVRSAITTCGFQWPPGRVTVNLSPADLPKDCGRFDLPIALAILAATCQMPALPRRAPRGVGNEPELEHLSNEQLQTSEINVSRPSDVGALSSL